MQMRNTYINRLQNIQGLRLLERTLEELLREESVMMSGINKLSVLPKMHFTYKQGEFIKSQLDIQSHNDTFYFLKISFHACLLAQSVKGSVKCVSGIKNK